MARPGLTLSVSGIAVWQMSLGFKEPSICLVERALTVAIFRSISTTSLNQTGANGLSQLLPNVA